MREIKFRGKDASDNWVYGSLISGTTGKGVEVSFIAPGLPVGTSNFEFWETRMIRVKPETVGQFTGWSRKGKFELYGGDVIGFDDWAFSERERKKMRHHVGVIEWSGDYGKWMIKCKDGYFEGNDVADPQLLGNIYDNPELLEGNEL